MTTTETNLIVQLPAKDQAITVFSAENGLDPYLQAVRAEIDAFVPDLETKKGRDEIASMAYKVARSKSALDDLGKQLVADLKEVPKKIDAERKRMRDLLDGWRDEVRAPLNAWEEAEEARMQAMRDKVQVIKSLAHVDGLTSDEIKVNINALDDIVIDDSYGVFAPLVETAKAEIMPALKTALASTEKNEADAAELAMLRKQAADQAQKDREAQIARDAVEAEKAAAAKREADAKAESDRREMQLRLQAELAEKEKQLAQQRAEDAARAAEARVIAAAEAERKRIADEQAEADRQTAARERDKAHKKEINNAALADFVAGGIDETTAKKIITLIASGKITNIRVNY